ncbi:MAG TPA: GNAT family N-acetyltransferase [Candidatus Acidoferrales bacterium]|nr:GNAT family N-acetyltransferase [Candidatus Acidoferrales bacterium]
MPTFSIREAGPNDIDLVARRRVAMAEESGGTKMSEALVKATHRWLRQNTERGIMRSWLAECDGKVVGSVSCRIRETSPREFDLAGKEAYVQHLYVDPPYRGLGIGRALMQALLDWCAANGHSRIALRTSEMARSLYERMGFAADRVMTYKGNT